MEFYGAPMTRGGFGGRNFRDFTMQRQFGRPYDFSAEFMYPMEYPYSFPRWNCQRGMGQRERGLRRRMAEHKHLKENKQKGKTNQGTPDDSCPVKTTAENEMPSQTCENVFSNLINSEEIDPFSEKFASLLKIFNEEGPFEVIVNIRGCDPDNIKVNIKKGILKIEGRTDAPDGGFTSVKHEQSIPKEVPVSSLKASLYPEGILRVRQEESSLNVPVHIEENPDGLAEEIFDIETNYEHMHQ